MIRECFVPRTGKIFIQADFPQLELYTLAQCCYTWLGHSALGEMLKKGVDPHTAFASKLAKVPYEEGCLLKDSGDKPFYRKRQVAKAFDFGKPGGLGNKKLKELAASPAYKVTITDEEAIEYSLEWHEMFPEMKPYFARVNKLLYGKETCTIVLPGTGFVRGGAKYCAACNTGFQGLGAACFKHAMWLVAKAQYVDTSSPLFGSRTVAGVHDEIIAETDPGPGMSPAAFCLAHTMADAANKFLPDCPIAHEKMLPTAMWCWSKDAKTVLDADGRLVPWVPKAA
jgi:DNA polymerase I-like protein with 3'-5' exonuclease and polymerase domains